MLEDSKDEEEEDVIELAEEQEAVVVGESREIATTVGFGGIQPLNVISLVVEVITEEDRIMVDKPEDKDANQSDLVQGSALCAEIQITLLLFAQRE